MKQENQTNNNQENQNKEKNPNQAQSERTLRKPSVKEKLINEVKLLKNEIDELKQFVQSQGMQFETLLTRVNRNELFQNQMDVMVRNHQHGPPPGQKQE